MYTLTVRDHVMVAHSLPRPLFGPAQSLHGATYVVEASFRRGQLTADGVVLDIGAARTALGEVLEPLRYRNLDEHPDFNGVITSTEVLAGWVGQHLARSTAAAGLDGIEVTLRESPEAWVTYTSGR